MHTTAGDYEWKWAGGGGGSLTTPLSISYGAATREKTDTEVIIEKLDEIIELLKKIERNTDASNSR